MVNFALILGSKESPESKDLRAEYFLPCSQQKPSDLRADVTVSLYPDHCVDRLSMPMPLTPLHPAPAPSQSGLTRGA